MYRIELGTVETEEDFEGGLRTVDKKVVDILYAWVRQGDPRKGIGDFEQHERRLFIMRHIKEAKESDADFIEFKDIEYVALKKAAEEIFPMLQRADEGHYEIMKRIREAPEVKKAKTRANLAAVEAE